MAQLVGNAIFGQSGGPTSVINASAAGVFTEALKQTDAINKVFGAAHGIKGILEENFYDMGEEDPYELELMKTTPSSALGSVRYKLADVNEDDTDYKRLLEVFKKYDIRYFFYNGGNDSMDTCNKISKFMQSSAMNAVSWAYLRPSITIFMALTIAPATLRLRSTSPLQPWKSIWTPVFMIPA